jgi:hypothetical protein
MAQQYVIRSGNERVEAANSLEAGRAAYMLTIQKGMAQVFDPSGKEYVYRWSRGAVRIVSERG